MTGMKGERPSAGIMKPWLSRQKPMTRCAENDQAEDGMPGRPEGGIKNEAAISGQSAEDSAGYPC